MGYSPLAATIGRRLKEGASSCVSTPPSSSAVPIIDFTSAYIPGFPGAHSQGETLDELDANLKEAIEMSLEDGEPKLDAEFVGIQTVAV